MAILHQIVKFFECTVKFFDIFIITILFNLLRNNTLINVALVLAYLVQTEQCNTGLPPF
jgi:hypothetical protein